MGFADYPFSSRYLSVDGHRLHYIDEGRGPTLLFLHGNPTSSYLWRNIIKPLRARYRCVALDLIGFGRSDKPHIDYRFLTHYHYLQRFVAELDLKDLTLVLHDWGGPLGFRLAQREPERVARLCFMETFPFTFDWEEFPLAARPLVFAFRDKRLAPWLLQRHNLFVDLVLRFSVLRPLPRSVLAAYRAPFPDARSRLPIRVFPSELPLNDRPGETHRAIAEIEANLPRMIQPMLLLHFQPGAVLSRGRVDWLARRIPHLEVVDGGAGLHYVQEDRPQTIAAALETWLDRLSDPAAVSTPISTSTTAPAPASAPTSAPTSTPRIAAEDDRYAGPLRWRWSPEHHGGLAAAWSEAGLVQLCFAADAEDGRAQIEKRFPKASLEPADPDAIDTLMAAPAATPLHLVGTPFQRAVWRALLAIPAGQTRQYGELAGPLNSQARAVGNAVGANRIALLVPCHRVVPRAGGPGAYHWGVTRKKALLADEGIKDL
ncbi:haloalkane dehalogenase [Alloalcanivorax gelatiniphagus]|uniref:Haloalkane dehalogenase n=1 Tax=Alloalcanivorax gelatiniphagus TaxID=1194167 RepID=A0ABY2XNW8_9GAMM|nr:haloalkane dehalogenase [Alloalcanivorax gelatiniphagus]TMW14167.1 haloalkane dehalogenase [Alloalcanivorax gelatiniphagus]